ncbi:hypothetical protein V5O48_014446 [Marasmius crinis-equi]|uniref:Beta-lactamase-related domain-containing protein n=1 Tax=Marasmius crinis-equi TaxID=585013 RepID=A0ABR3EXB8_9AGAR
MSSSFPSLPKHAHAQKLLTPELDEFIESTLASWGGYSGAGVAVVRRGDGGAWEVETKGYGARGDGGKVDANTLFGIGSNTKLFNTVTVGMLIADESVTPRISFNTRVADVIPGFELGDPTASKEATIQDLASHRTGLPTHDYSYTTEDNITSIVGRLKDLKTAAGFREVFQYSNICYGVLSYLPEVLSTKMKFARYVKQHIFDPLGMSSSTFSHDVALKSGNVASGVGRDNMTDPDLTKATPRTMPSWANDTEDGSYLSGAGGIISNARDMAVWLQTLMGNGQNPANGQSVIPPAVLASLVAPYSIANEFSFGALVGDPSIQALFSPVAYGAGELTNSYRGHVMIEHSGDVPGFHSQVSRLPYDNLGVVVLTNDHEFGIQVREIIKFRILDTLLGLQPVDINTAVRKTVAASLSQVKAPRPANASEPSVGSISSLAGEYTAPGYGSTLEFCAFIPDQQPSESCQKMIAGKAIVDPKIPTLLAEINTVLATHISLSHFNGNIFNITMMNVLPTGDPKKPYWAARTSGGAMIGEFSEDDSGSIGLGITGGFWGRGSPRGPSGKTVKERSEVYWSRQKSGGDGGDKVAHAHALKALHELPSIW